MHFHPIKESQNIRKDMLNISESGKSCKKVNVCVGGRSLLAVSSPGVCSNLFLFCSVSPLEFWRRIVLKKSNIDCQRAPIGIEQSSTGILFSPSVEILRMIGTQKLHLCKQIKQCPGSEHWCWETLVCMA